MNIKKLAFYLPQFHPFPENDNWWGKGFTEWTNVTKAKPLFEGHYQPHLPTDLGFYDLRLPSVMEEQAALAKSYAIDGFCFYHYWFNGKRLMHEPIDNLLNLKKPDFPFMMCWANENWTRTWDGMEKELLIKQEYSLADDKEHIQFLINKLFKDPRYIKVDGKPFFLIYRPQLFPQLSETIELWRSEVKKAGFEDIYLGYVQSFGFKEDPLKIGLDCAVAFEPDFSQLGPKLHLPMVKRLKNKLLNKGHNLNYKKNNIYSYDVYASKAIANSRASDVIYPCVFPGWDNSPRRRKGATIFIDSTVEKYGEWLQRAIDDVKKINPKYPYVFINAWNEWAEGNHLEPCRKFGRKYLEETKRVKY